MRRTICGLTGTLLAAGLMAPAAGAPDEALRIDGYIQARAIVTERASAAYAFQGSSFLARRVRVRLRHSVGIARGVIQIDGAATANPIIRDAYVQVPFGVGGETKPFTFWAGQFKVPFGYAIAESSRDRLFPERPVGFELDSLGLTLFPTTRDRGLRLTYEAGPLTADAAVVNGGGIGAPTVDPDKSKDAYGRVSYKLGTVSAAASGRVGSQAFGGANRQRSVWGLGVNVTPLLAGTLTAEFATGRDASAATNRTTPQAWYVQYVYPLGEKWLLGARYTAFDPDTGNRAVPGAGGEERGPGLALAYQPDPHLRLTGSFEMPRVTTVVGRRSASVAVIQTQYAF